MAAGQPFDQRRLVLTWSQRGLFAAYLLAWHLALPLALLYFWHRGRKEPLYRQFLNERFGLITCGLKAPIWLHSASLGELRGVMPLIDKMLAEGLPLLITTLTPAGRTAATQRYAQAIHAGQLQVSYLPLELPWAIRAFAKRVNPRCMLSSEIDTWPALLHTLKAMGIPLGFVNAQYPQKSFMKDKSWVGVRAAFFRAYDLVLCKSQLHAQRFIETGCKSVNIVGELRFDLPPPAAHLLAAKNLRENQPRLFGDRGVVCIASIVEGEDEMLLEAYQEFSLKMQSQGKVKPLLVYVPRSPQRFDAVAQLITSHGLTYLRRSQDLDSEFQWMVNVSDAVDVLLGDSLGEMYFYLALADTVTVCGSFIPRGSHNVIEPLALNKPVVVGPSIWGIEYPGQEALAAGVLTQVQEARALPAQWLAWFTQPDLQKQSRTKAQAFMREHSGSVDKHWQHLRAWLKLP
jgi:3-deoxy-D-manno-octulosonic-acid transferase